MLLSKTIALLGPQHKKVLIKLAYNDQEKEREYLVSSVEDDSNSIKAEVDIVNTTMTEEQKDEQLLFT